MFEINIVIAETHAIVVIYFLAYLKFNDPIWFPINVHAADSNPYANMYPTKIIFIMIIVVAWSSTPNNPLIKIYNSHTHQSKHIINANIEPILIYSGKS